MKMKFLLIILITISSFAFSCQKADQSAPESETVPAEESFEPDALSDELMMKRGVVPGGEGTDDASTGEKKKDADRGIETPFYTEFDESMGRQLEYRADLNFETKNLFKSRKQLLEVVKKYGFIKNSTTSTEYSNIYLSANIAVRSSELYDVLLDLQDIGVLVNERITVTDHTEEMVMAERKIKREQLRIARKNRAISQVAPGAKTWTEREQSLERSENELDQKEHDRWKITDRVYWAEVTMYVKGPVTAETIEVPRYRNALIGLVNGLLVFLYGLIYAVPFIAIALVIWFKRGFIKNIFKRK